MGVWDGLEECEISLPVMCSVTIQSLANKILNVSYFVLLCQYDVRYRYQHDTKTGSSTGYFYLSTCQSPYFFTLT